MFYMNHSLCSSAEKNSWFHKKDFLSKDKIIECLKKSKSGPNIDGKTVVLLDPKVVVYKRCDDTVAELILVLPIKHTTSDRIYEHQYAHINLAVTQYNCGSVHLSNLYTSDGHGSGLAWEFLKLAEEWCIYAGYTMLFGNVAGSYQCSLIPKFEQAGYTKMGESYKNKRTGNVNVWLQKIIQDQDSIREEGDEDDDYYDEDNHDEDRDEDF